MTTRIGALAIISPSQARQEILDAIIEGDGKLTEAAQYLGLYTERKYSGLRTLYRIIADLGMWQDIESEMQKRGIQRRVGRPLGEHEVRRAGTPRPFQRGPTPRRRAPGVPRPLTPRGATVVPQKAVLPQRPGPEPERKAVQLGKEQSTPRLSAAELRQAGELSKQVGRREKTPVQKKPGKKEPEKREPQKREPQRTPGGHRIVGAIPSSDFQAETVLAATVVPARAKTPSSKDIENISINIPSDVIDQIRAGKALHSSRTDTLFDAAVKTFAETRGWRPSHSLRDWLMTSGYAADETEAKATLTLRAKGDDQATDAVEASGRGLLWNSETHMWERPTEKTLSDLKTYAATEFARFLSSQTLVDSGATARDAIARSYTGVEAPRSIDEASTRALHATLSSLRLSEMLTRFNATQRASKKTSSSNRKKRR